MKFRTALSLATFFLLFFTVAVWRSPLSACTKEPIHPAPGVQSVSGKISSVGDAEFTLDLGRSQNPDKLTFLIDSETKVEGKLSIGVQATVDYRSADGKNIATHVTVMPASGFQSY